jgi:PA domain
MRTRRGFLKLIGGSTLGGMLLRRAPIGVGVIASSVVPRTAAADCPGATITFNEGGTTVPALTAVNINGANFVDGTSLPVRALSGAAPSFIGLGCNLTDYGGVAGSLVVTQRGSCSPFDVRATYAQQAGAAAVVMVNNTADFPPFEGAIAGVSIPFFGVRSTDGIVLRNAASLGGPATLANTTITTCGVIPFATFAAQAALSLRHKTNDGEFAMAALFTLGAASNGINPLNEAVTLVWGTGHWTIAAGSFHQIIQGQNVFGFRGLIGATSLDVLLSQLPDGSFQFEAAGIGANLAGTANPVPVNLTIGNDSGQTTVVATIRP